MKPLSLIFLASLAFGQTAKICITNPQGATICNSITDDAFTSASDFAKASCRDIPAVTEQVAAVTEIVPAVVVDGKVVPPETTRVVTPGYTRIITPASTKCEYTNARQVLLKHVEGYLRDLKVQYPAATLKKLRKAADDAVVAVTVEQAKPILTEVTP
jgi:hypothetical protein